MNFKRNLLAMLALVILVLSGCAAVVPADAAPVAVAQAYVNTVSAETQVLEFEISEDMGKFVFNKDIAFEDGMPAHGSNFITEGYIYEAGTLNGSNGVNADGSPEFPDKVMGKWICMGAMYGDAAHADGGPWVVSTQYLMFDEAHGGGTLVTEGLEYSDIGAFNERIITGGSGRFFNVPVEAEQALEGFNATEGVVLSYRVMVHQ